VRFPSSCTDGEIAAEPVLAHSTYPSGRTANGRHARDVPPGASFLSTSFTRVERVPIVVAIDDAQSISLIASER